MQPPVRIPGRQNAAATPQPVPEPVQPPAPTPAPAPGPGPGPAEAIPYRSMRVRVPGRQNAAPASTAVVVGDGRNAPSMGSGSPPPVESTTGLGHGHGHRAQPGRQNAFVPTAPAPTDGRNRPAPPHRGEPLPALPAALGRASVVRPVGPVVAAPPGPQIGGIASREGVAGREARPSVGQSSFVRGPAAPSVRGEGAGRIADHKYGMAVGAITGTAASAERGGPGRISDNRAGHVASPSPERGRSAPGGVARMGRALGHRMRLEVPNNNGLYNAAFNGYISGVYQLISQVNVPLASSEAVEVHAAAFAAEVDGLIAPTAVDTSQSELLYGICESTNAQRYDIGVNGYLEIAEAVVALYKELVTSLFPISTSDIVDNFQGYPLQGPTPPVDLQLYIWNGAEYQLRQLTQDDILPAFAIDSFTGGSTVEIGATVTNPVFAATYSSLPVSAEITNTDGIDSPLVLTTPFTAGTVVGAFTSSVEANVTFTLTAVAATTKTATQTIFFAPRMFGGVAAPGATGATASGSTAILTGVSGTLANEGLTDNPVGSTYGPFTPAAQCVYLLLTGGAHTFKDASTGFAFAFNAPTPVAFVNQEGAAVAMYLYQSTNTLTGTFSVLVVS